MLHEYGEQATKDVQERGQCNQRLVLHSRMFFGQVRKGKKSFSCRGCLRVRILAWASGTETGLLAWCVL